MSYTCPLCSKRAPFGPEGCEGTLIRVHDQVLARIKHGDEEGWAEVVEECGWPEVPPCHDCNASLGALHHPGCDMERCPGCGGQMLFCEWVGA